MKQKILQARPRLSQVAPLTNAICWIFVIINIVLGLGMYFLYQTSIELAVANILSYQQWGLLFGSSGLLSAYSLIRNEHMLTKRLLWLGLCLKAIWAIALVIRCLTAPQTILITAVWVGLLSFQAVTYIYFFPRSQAKESNV